MCLSLLRKLIVSLLLCIISIQSYAELPVYSWLVRDLARAPLESIKLRDEKDRLLYTINTKQMVYLYAAMISITDASETLAEFIIIDGEHPNAFAGELEGGQNFVAINFAMLDILGTNLDMVAALLGHELAHLKLNHGEQIKLNSGKDFSVANTRYSRDNEREADYLGTIWAVEAGYDPKGAVTLQEELYKYSNTITSSGFNASHPSSIERITILKSLVRRLSNK